MNGIAARPTKKSDTARAGVPSSRQASGLKAKRIFQDNYQLYLLMLPAIVATFIFAYMPMYGVIIALKDYHTSQGIWGSPWVGLDQFEKLIRLPNFWPMLRNTLVLTLYDFGATFPLSILIALLINEIQSQKFKKVVQMVTYAPHFLSTVIVCSLVTLFFARGNGIINNVIETLGGQRIAFMESPRAFPSLYVWSGFWQDLGWSTIIYLAALSNVSPELVESAVIDGASRWKIIRHINIPGILPTVTILLIMQVGNVLSVSFEKILLLQNNLNMSSSEVLATYVYLSGVKRGQFSLASAAGLFNTVVGLVLVLTVNAISKRISEVSLW